MFNVNNFRNHFAKHEDYAKSSRFEVRIGAPSSQRDLVSLADGLRFQCEASELPGYNINTVDNRIYGVPNPVASTATFSDITMTFICAGDMWEKKFFDAWMDVIVPIDNYNPRYKDDYSGVIYINQYTDISSSSATKNFTPTAAQQLRYSAVLHGAFPISISPLSLNWADDQFHKLSVTFKYEYWTQANLKGGRSIAANPSGSNRVSNFIRNIFNA